MAYRFPFSDVLTSASRREQAVRSAPEGFDAQEALVFWVAMRDGPETVRTPMLGRWFEILLGIAPVGALTNPRLESIRRLTVCLHHHLDRQTPKEMQRAREEGVTETQIGSLIARLREPPKG